MARTRWGPTISLALLAPLVAEYLLGSMAVRQIGLLPVMAAMYGSGALLIREVARRTGRGWMAIALLGLAYGIIEEGLVDQSLFGRDFLHLRLLDYRYLSALGTALPWLVYVLAIHVVWSIALPIGLAEALFPAHREQPWLGPVALSVAALLYVAVGAAIATLTWSMTPVSASPGQLAGAAGAAVVAVAAALLVPRPRAASGVRPAFAAPLAFAVAFIAGSALMGCRQIALARGWPWQACVVSLLVAAAAFVTFALIATRDRSVTGHTRFAIITAGLAVYAVFGIQTDRALHGAADLPGHLGVIFAFALIVLTARRRMQIDGLRTSCQSPSEQDRRHGRGEQTTGFGKPRVRSE